MSNGINWDLGTECDHGYAMFLAFNGDEAKVCVQGLDYWVDRTYGVPTNKLLSHIPEFKVRNKPSNRDKAIKAGIATHSHGPLLSSHERVIVIVDALIKENLLAQD